MNSNEVFARFEAGDYAGTREINGVQHPGLLREYAQGVADGLANTAEVRAARTPLSVAMKSPGTA